MIPRCGTERLKKEVCVVDLTKQLDKDIRNPKPSRKGGTNNLIRGDFNLKRGRGLLLGVSKREEKLMGRRGGGRGKICPGLPCNASL